MVVQAENFRERQRSMVGALARRGLGHSSAKTEFIEPDNRTYVSYKSDRDGVVIRWGYPSMKAREAYYLISFDLVSPDADRTKPESYKYGFTVFYNNRYDRRFVKQEVSAASVSNALATRSTTLSQLLLDYLQQESKKS